MYVCMYIYIYIAYTNIIYYTYEVSRRAKRGARRFVSRCAWPR